MCEELLADQTDLELAVRSVPVWFPMASEKDFPSLHMRLVSNGDQSHGLRPLTRLRLPCFSQIAALKAHQRSLPEASALNLEETRSASLLSSQLPASAMGPGLLSRLPSPFLQRPALPSPFLQPPFPNIGAVHDSHASSDDNPPASTSDAVGDVRSVKNAPSLTSQSSLKAGSARSSGRAISPASASAPDHSSSTSSDTLSF